MKVVINQCFGGFSLSPRAVKRLAEMDGRKCYFFVHEDKSGKVNLRHHRSVSMTEAEKGIFWTAFDVPNPDEVIPSSDNWASMSDAEKQECNQAYRAHSLPVRPDSRTDPKLIQVIEELGKKANGSCADLKIVEIPDDVDWEIDDYDGSETIHEKHRSWS